MPYLDEQGLKTLVDEIKDYALQKTTVEKQFEYTNSNSTTKYVCLESFTIPSDITDYMIVADITQTPFSNATRVGKLILYHNTSDNKTYAALYGDINDGDLATALRYTSSIMDNTRYINIYVSTPAKASTLIHVHGINANFETAFAPSDYTIKDKWPSNVNAVNINTHVTIFADLRKSIKDLRDDVNTLQGLTGGSTSLGANHVVVTTDSKALTSVATLPISKGGTNATTAKAAQYNLLKDMNSDTTSVTDDLRVVAAYTKPNTTNGAVAYKKMSYFWTYIANKIRSTFGFSDSNVLPVKNGGTGGTTKMTARTGLGLHVGLSKATIKEKTGRTWVPLPAEAQWCIASFILCYSNWEPMPVQVASDLISKRGIKLIVAEGVNSEDTPSVFIERNSNTYEDADYFIINILYSTGGVEEWKPYS